MGRIYIPVVQLNHNSVITVNIEGRLLIRGSFFHMVHMDINLSLLSSHARQYLEKQFHCLNLQCPTRKMKKEKRKRHLGNFNVKPLRV